MQPTPLYLATGTFMALRIKSWQTAAAAALAICAWAAVAAQAQNPPTPVRLVWKGAADLKDRYNQPCPRLTGKGLQHNADEGLNPTYTQAFAGAVAFSIAQPLYRPLSQAEKALFDTTTAGRPAVRLEQATIQHRTQTFATVRLLRRNPATGQLERLMQFVPVVQPQGRAEAVARTQGPGGTPGPATPTADTTLQPLLASGSWGKIGVTQSGVYRLTADDLRRIGIDPNNIDARNLHIYGRGGRNIPEVVGAAAPGLRELAIQVTGEADGRLDPGDRILFYAQGPVTWSYNSVAGTYVHDTHLYADTIQYIVGANARPGLRMQPQGVDAPTATLNSYTNMVLFEKEAINLLKAGRRWFSEQFTLNNSRDVVLPTPGLAAGAPATLRLVTAARAIGGPGDTAGTYFSASVGGSVVAASRIPITTAYPFGPNYFDADTRGTFPAPGGDNLVVQLAYNRTRYPDAIGVLDFIEAGAPQQATWRSRSFEAWLPGQLTAGPAWLPVSNAPASVQAWHLADPLSPTQLPIEAAGIRVPGGLAVHMAVVAPEQTQAPILLGNLPTQSLATADVPQLLILAPAGLRAQAQAYADYRISRGVPTLVATLPQVYNEFSGGHQDIGALRDFVLSLYNRSNNLRHVLLFGKPSVDFKYRIANNTNLVPAYQSRGWANPIDAWASDDFYVVLTPGQGNLNAGGNRLSLSVGRFCIKNATEADALLAKAKAYETDTTALGAWRNINAFIADNGDFLEHVRQSDGTANLYQRRRSPFLPDKYFLPAYPLVAGPGGLTSPQMRSSIQRRMRAGALLLNYTGHGSEFQWADERVFDMDMIPTLDNGPRLPFFMTLTCEFGRLDDPGIVSGAEALMLKGDGGSIATFSACRPVFSISNKQLHDTIYNYLFTPIQGRMPTLGELTADAKNQANAGYNQQYILFGDPSMTLVYPKHNVRMTALTDDQGNRVDTIRALQTVTMSGVVETRAGQTLPNYSGQVQVTLYDKASLIGINDNGSTYRFSQRKSIIFNGATRVDSGRWSITFQLPLDINYIFGSGLASFYAKPTQGLEDANGIQTDNLVIGGSAPFVADDTPPRVALFMNDTTFRNGGVVGPNPVFVARVSDNTGINVSLSGIGHEMTGTFSNAPQETVVMNSFYVSDLGRPNRGTVRFPLQGLAPGTYNVRFTVWDLYNNSATDSLRFTVREANCPGIARATVIPNPVSDKARFEFDIDQPGKPMTVDVTVYDAVGKQVGRRTIQYDEAPARAGRGLEWYNGPGSGKLLQNGMYLYRIQTTSPGGCSASAQGRMVINQ